MKKPRILITTFPYGETGKKPLEILKETGWEIVNNPLGRRIKPKEVPEIIKGFDAVIAGTEPYPAEAIKESGVKLICRVGIGLDNIPLKFCKENNIGVTYTPDAPSQAVAELTVAQIINLTRFVTVSNRSVREGAWNRFMGKLISDMKIGIIGIGRIGQIVVKLLEPFNPTILACDIAPNEEFGKTYKLKWYDKNYILENADVVTVHIPNSKSNYHFMDRYAFARMKTGSFLINTSRGPIVDEEALYDAVIQNHLEGAALDVFKHEPYEGQLTKLQNIIFTAHMGASAKGSRYLMELGAAEDCIRVLKGEMPKFNALTDENILMES